MGTSLSQAAAASHRITAEDRMERIGQLTTRQQTDALLWLAGYAPSVFDAVAEAIEPCASDGSEDLKFGLDWRHYTGTDTSDIELLDPGRRPVLAWRTPGLPV